MTTQWKPLKEGDVLGAMHPDCECDAGSTEPEIIYGPEPGVVRLPPPKCLVCRKPYVWVSQ